MTYLVCVLKRVQPRTSIRSRVACVTFAFNVEHAIAIAAGIVETLGVPAFICKQEWSAAGRLEIPVIEPSAARGRR